MKMNGESSASLAHEHILQIQPEDKLVFKGTTWERVSVYITMKNPSDKKIFFKIKTTQPKGFTVTPNYGFVFPKDTIKIEVIRKRTDNVLRSKEKFLIESIAPNEDFPDNVIVQNIWKDISTKYAVMNFKLPTEMDEVSSPPCGTFSGVLEEEQDEDKTHWQGEEYFSFIQPNNNQQMITNNSVITNEDIVSRSNNIYVESYFCAKDALLDDGYDDNLITDWLLTIYMESFELSQTVFNKSKENLFTSLKDIFSKYPFSRDHPPNVHKHFGVGVCSMIRESSDPKIKEEILKDVFGTYSEHCKGEKSREMLKRFTTECINITWLMNTCDPSMHIHADGEVFDSTKHIRMGGYGTKIDKFLWPCIYASKDDYNQGKVLARGFVVKGH